MGVPVSDVTKYMCPLTIISGKALPCVGALCMAFRTHTEKTSTTFGTVPKDNGWVKTHVTGEGGLVTKEQHWEREVGSCGMVSR